MVQWRLTVLGHIIYEPEKYLIRFRAFKSSWSHSYEGRKDTHGWLNRVQGLKASLDGDNRLLY